MTSPVVIRKRSKVDCAATIYDGKTYRITIKQDQPDVGLIDSLLHEWSHVLAIEEAYEHEGRWAVLFGQVYQAWTKDFPEKIQE